MVKITATFLDEITHDIPSLNYTEQQWDREFALMKSVGIDTAVMIRCGHRRFMTFPSEVLQKQEHAFVPPTDMLAMFLRLCEKHGIRFFFGTYYSGRDWLLASYDPVFESELMCKVCDEAHERYLKFSPAFAGWYLSQEISDKRSFNVVKCYKMVGKHCKSISGGKPVMISPAIMGPKISILPPRRRQNPITPERHREEWDWIFGEISGIVDIAAFQDGHVDYEDLETFLKINAELAAKHRIELWTNAETFDRDIPGSMPPIDWRKLYIKLNAAEHAGITQGITFDFAHMLSPNASPAAGNLLRHYCAYAGIPFPENS
ncbi:MAG: DUF4434 domain-containing protein [Lentisphaeria bacterium]|jgi:hypothetical protein|nr:DUF4434 domain-containing protein [Lentisphaeria bacterium]